MTFKPYLQIQRLVVLGHNRTVYDESFHNGVNIIRGKNSSGKSTISDMIFYVLGGENVEWTTEGASCDWVHAEFNISGTVYSLRREIDPDAVPAISIAEGTLDATMKSPVGWSLYGRTRSSTRESFSQFMFEHLGLPQTKSSESQANITMYQVLRLLYGDQKTDCSSIFRREKERFADRNDIRRSIGEMLLGIDDLMGHELRQKQIQAVKTYSEKKSRYESLLEAAEKADPNFCLADYADKVRVAQSEQQALEASIEKLSSEAVKVEKKKKSHNQNVKKLEKEIQKVNENVARLRDDEASLRLNIADSEAFVSSLEGNLRDLMSANKTRDLIGEVALTHCPLCLADLTVSDDDACPLCKSSSADEKPIVGRLRYEQELKHQISESKQLLAAKSERLVTLSKELGESVSARNQSLSKLRSLVSPTFHFDAQASDMLKKHGYLSRAIEDLNRMNSLQKQVRELEKEVADAKLVLEQIERQIQATQERQDERREYCQSRIGELTVEVLHKDVVDGKNDTVRDATGLVYSFEKDFLSVRSGRLSASTQAFLKDSFYLALLKFAVEDDQSRLPLFFILDNIEDKGMTPERFRMFHHLLVDYSESTTIPHQVILTTSYIDAELDNSPYCVGLSYDRPPFTLDLTGEWQSAAHEKRTVKSKKASVDNQDATQLSENDDVQSNIVQAIRKKLGLTNTELAKLVGVSPATLSKRLKELVEKGVIERVGPAKRGGHWEVLK